MPQNRFQDIYLSSEDTILWFIYVSLDFKWNVNHISGNRSLHILKHITLARDGRKYEWLLMYIHLTVTANDELLD